MILIENLADAIGAATRWMLANGNTLDAETASILTEVMGSTEPAIRRVSTFPEVVAARRDSFDPEGREVAAAIASWGGGLSLFTLRGGRGEILAAWLRGEVQQEPAPDPRFAPIEMDDGNGG